MPEIGLLTNLQQTLTGNQNNNSLQSVLSGPLTLNKYSEIIKPFIQTKTAPDNLANEIRTKANTEGVLMVLDKAGIIKHITNKFYLASMQMSMREKVQLMETFGAANISFFGESARVYIFNAAAIDAPSQDTGINQGKYYYQSSILKMYNDVLRGTQLIKKDRIAVLKINNHLIYGYPLNLQVSYSANTDPVTQFVLQFVVSEHTLELPGVVSEKYLDTMYSTASHIDNDAIWEFWVKIDSLQEKIQKILDTKVDGEEYGSAGSIESIQNASYSWYNYQPDSMKSAYTSLLSSNVNALKTSLSSILKDDISPLVHSKVPANTLDRLVALIPTMFKDEETFNLVATNLRNLILLKREIEIFRSYKINR